MTVKEGIYIDADTLNQFYHMHEESLKDLIDIKKIGEERYDELWLENPSDIEHRSVFETTYYSNRSFLCLVGVENEESLDKLESKILKKYNKTYQNEPGL